jgi:hypothetical protein
MNCDTPRWIPFSEILPYEGQSVYLRSGSLIAYDKDFRKSCLNKDKKIRVEHRCPWLPCNYYSVEYIEEWMPSITDVIFEEPSEHKI